MGTPLHIALRYLFAKKSHNVINIISIISAAGIAIGSMALILILSVYNGFDNSIREIYESYKADFVIAPTKGKLLTFTEDNVTVLHQGAAQVFHIHLCCTPSPRQSLLRPKVPSPHKLYLSGPK